MNSKTQDIVTENVIKAIKLKDYKISFEIIVNKYSKQLYWHIRRIVISHDDANDVLQNTFIKIWKYLPNFKGDSKIFTWLYRIATNESLTFLTKKKKTASINTDIIGECLVTQVEVSMDSTEIQKRLEEAIATLPDKQRVVFNLKYFEDLKYADIAIITDTSIGALKASYHIAVKKIEKYLIAN